MTQDLVLVSAFNLLYLTAKLILCLVLVALFDGIIWRKVSFKDEIAKGNMAVALFVGLVLAAIILSTSLR